MEDLTKALSDLKLKGRSNEVNDTVISNSTDCILKCLAQKEGPDRQAVIELLIQNGVLNPLVKTLKSSPTNFGLTAKIAELMAELTKVDVARQACSDVSVLGPLVDLLACEDNATVVQICRALGHICFDNDTARSLVKEQQGVVKIVQLLQRLVRMKELSPSLKTIAAGCLLNLTDSCVQEHALQAGVVEVALQYLEKYHTDEDIASHCFVVLSCLADWENGRTKLTEHSTLKTLVELFHKQLSTDLLESLLELLGNLAESDGVKYELVKLDLAGCLLQVFDKYRGQEKQASLFKMACDLIILILTGDASMELLYMGPVYKEILSWLQSPDEDLQIAGALASGNFARKDGHCIQMVQDGIPQELLALLNKHTTKDGDIRLQHALLAALRNLSIPATNKPILVKLGVVETALNMLHVDTFPVVFKLLGMLRMLISGQKEVAEKLGKMDSLITRLSEWAATEDHPGVQGEAVRLLAGIAAAAPSPKLVEAYSTHGALRHLGAMVQSEHVVMQAEATLALAHLWPQKADVMETELHQMGDIVFRKLSTPPDNPDLIKNLLELALSLVSSSTKLKEELRTTGLPAALTPLVKSGVHKDAASKLLHTFD